MERKNNLIKKLIMIIIVPIILIMIKNVSYAATYSGTSGVESLLSADPKTVLKNDSTISLSFQDLKSSSKLYCMEKGQSNKSQPAEYRILTYIEINGWNAKVWQRNDDTGNADYQGERDSSSNAILAEILSGNYGDKKTGYGSGVNQYTSAQKAFYEQFKAWQGYVGVELGIDNSWSTCNDYIDDGTGAKIVSEATNKVKTEGSNATARIYLLDNAQWDSWQRLAVVEANSTSTPEEPPEEQPDFDGYIKIRGKVWVDGEAGKSNLINGKYGDSSDKGLGGITVKLLDSSGNEFTGGSHATTDGSGNYEIVVNLDTRENIHVYKLWENPESVEKKLMNGAYVQFEYNGYKYTTVTASTTGQNTSKATEDNNSRSSLDSNYTTVTPESSVPSAIVTASTETQFKFKNYTDMTTETENPTIVYCYGEGINESDKDGVKDPTDRRYQLTNTSGAWLDVQYKYNQVAHNRQRHSHDESFVPPRYVWNYDENGIQIPGTNREIYKDVFDKMTWCSGGHSIKTTSITNLIINNVNLGLFEREQPDAAITSDIDRVEVIMNNQKYTYKYKSQIGTPSYDDQNRFGTVKFQNKYTYTYRKEVNPADIAYINDGAPDNTLQMYVTYKVTFANQSNTLEMKIHKIKSSYDPEYTIVSSGWQHIPNNAGYRTSVSGDLNIKLSPGTKSEPIEVTYSISQKAMKELIEKDATLSNVFEIHTYSTQYGSNTLYAEQRTGGRTGRAYAGRDKDSTPGNAGPYIATRDIKVNGSVRKEEVLDITKIEDDTDIAPSFIVELKKYYKTIGGTVYEDSQTDLSKQQNERLGNGIKDGKEVGVAGVRVELIDKDTGKVAELYQVDRNGKKFNKIPAVAYTDANGNFTIGNTEQCGLVVNNYYIKYIYGNNAEDRNVQSTINGISINARDYKSTIVTQNPIKAIMQGERIENSTKWHLLDGIKNTTTAVDDIELRKNTTDNTSLKYSNFEQKFNMEANSIPFELQVEYTLNPFANDVDSNGSTAELDNKKSISTFDFGIIERAREDLVIDKSATKIKLTLANGQIMIEGKPGIDKMDYTKVAGIGDTTQGTYSSPKYRNQRQKLITIEMDAEYIQGATLEVWYAITASNLSEKDYQYTSNPKYYYYGNSTGLNLIQNSIERVIDYLDPELMCDLEHEYNKNWKAISIDELYNQGYISENTKKELSTNKYLAVYTDIFADKKLSTGKSYTESLHVSKLLANKDSELSYENHTEIIQINGETARTINSVNDKTRNPIAKTYKPGDYIPDTVWNGKYVGVKSAGAETAGLHEQDDDMVKIVITPPTGLNSNIMIYIVTAVIALSVLGIGIYIIKKKVLK